MMDRFLSNHVLTTRLRSRLLVMVMAIQFAAEAGVAQSSAQRNLIIRSSDQLVTALRRPRPGTTLFLAPGVYHGPIGSTRIRGTREHPIVIAALDPKRKPILRGGGDTLKLTDPAFVVLRDLVIEGASGIGLHLDDGGSYDSPGHDIQIIGVEVRDAGDHGVKLTGIDRVRITGLVASDWRGGGGCGINLIGCHEVSIQGSTFVNTEQQAFGGLQLKGGCTDVVIQKSRFVRCGLRAIQIGGATSSEAFRPSQEKFEASRVTLRNNVIVGGEASFAFVNCEDVQVSYNTIFRPTTWLVRLLHENQRARILSTRNVSLSDNLVVYQANAFFEAVNVGRNTDPRTLKFERNLWFRQDRPSDSRPSLPVTELDGVYGVDPEFLSAETLDLRPRPGSPASDKGAYAQSDPPQGADRSPTVRP